MRFVDTNIFIRHLTRDDPEKAQACYQLFLSAQRNEVALTTSEAVIAEVVYVLSSKQLYNLPREQIRALLYPLLTLRGFKLSGREIYLRALDVYASSDLDFEDAIAVAHMERHQLSEIYSYDRHFDQMSGLTRLEP
jgi:predicted nucleic acid-binding protein